jgi:hypothetical protein
MSNDLAEFFDSGMNDLEKDSAYNEPFTYNSGSYGGTFNNVMFQQSLTNGGFKNVYGSTLVVRKSRLTVQPKIGEFIFNVNTNTNLEIAGVENELTTYTITLIDKNK